MRMWLAVQPGKRDGNGNAVDFFIFIKTLPERSPSVYIRVQAVGSYSRLTRVLRSVKEQRAMNRLHVSQGTIEFARKYGKACEAKIVGHAGRGTWIRSGAIDICSLM